MTDRLDLPNSYREVVETLLRKHMPEAEVWAYGSRVNGMSHPGSDLDLVLRSPTLEQLGDGFHDLVEAFQESNIPILIQAHDWARLPEHFHREIERDYVVVQEGAEQTAADEWREVALGEVADIVMGQSPSGETVSPNRGLALLNGPTEFGIHHPTPVQFTTDVRKSAQQGNILFCVRGSTTGRMNWADQEYAIGRGIAAIHHRDEPALQPLIRGVIELALPELLAQATGSTFPNVSASQLAELPYPNLDKEEQHAIAHILGTLDDKIELNRRMNETLEEMARALFQSWFVDFDPVRAKMEGRDTGLPPDLAALFPDRIVDSELGLIPEGWEVRALGEAAEQLRDNENPQSSPSATFSHFSIPAFDQGKVPIREYGANIKSAKTCIRPGVVLISKLNPEIERVWLVDVEPGERAVCSTEFLVLQAHPPLQRSYIYCLARSPLFREQIESLVTGTSKSHQRAQPGAILSLQVVIPSEPVIHAFDRQASELLTASLAHRSEAITLAEQRDVLLPRLVSGEARIGEPKSQTGQIT